MSRACEENFVRKLFSLHWAIAEKIQTSLTEGVSGHSLRREGRRLWKSRQEGGLNLKKSFPSKCNLKLLEVWHVTPSALWICKLFKSFSGMYMYVSLCSITTVNTQKTCDKRTNMNIGVTAKKLTIMMPDTKFVLTYLGQVCCAEHNCWQKKPW